MDPNDKHRLLCDGSQWKCSTCGDWIDIMNVETEESASTNQKDGNMVLRLREEHKLDFTATGNLKILSAVEVFHPVRTHIASQSTLYLLVDMLAMSIWTKTNTNTTNTVI